MRADKFKPLVEKLVSDVLTECVKMTPVRDAGLIEAAQQRQYDHRINYIPSVHTREDPTLIVNGDQHWLWSGGKWYLASEWRLPPQASASYHDLLTERNRRIQRIGNRPFINDRKQARFLYAKSWSQCATSLNVPIRVAGQITRSHTRRRPPKEPRRGYGQWRGGKDRLTAVIYNPFLNEPSMYKDFDPRQILMAADAKARPRFNRQMEKQIAGLVRIAARI